jgi:hypothetical protein
MCVEKDTTVSITISVCGLLWCVIPCILVDCFLRFSGTCYHILTSQDGGSKPLPIISIYQTNPKAAHSTTPNTMRTRFRKKTGFVFVRLSSAALLKHLPQTQQVTGSVRSYR